MADYIGSSFLSWSCLNSTLLSCYYHWTKIQTDDAITITIKLEFDEPKYPSVLVNSQNLSIFQRFQILIIFNIIIKHKIWTGNLISPYSVFTSLKLSELIIFCHCGRYNVIWNDSSLRLHPKYLNLAHGTLSLLKVGTHLKEYASWYLIKMRHSPRGILPRGAKLLDLKYLSPAAQGIWGLAIWLL